MPEANTHEDSRKTEKRATVKRALLHGLAVLLFYTLLFVLFFAPVLFSAYLLAPGDGILYFLPNFYARRVWWDVSIWGGFPAVGDSQLMLWYPPALVFSIFKSWNAFLLSAYVLAASFTYAYTYALTRSRFAATLSGICYGMSGFIMAHLGHAALIHAAAWLPLFILSLEKLARNKNEGHAKSEHTRSGQRKSLTTKTHETARNKEHEFSVFRFVWFRVSSWIRFFPLSQSHKFRFKRFSSFWYAVCTLTVACCALAGHPQIFVYTLALGGAYALVRGWQTARRWAYYALSALAVLTGTGLAALQLWPTAELAALSLRASLGFAEFTSYALPLRQTPMLLFPYLFGGSPGTLYDVPYFGAWGSQAGGWGAGELSGYMGLLPLLLAAIGFVATKRRGLGWFWLITCAVAFLLALGDATPLARLTYHLPVINKFRVPARHFMELSFGVSVLAGFGAHALVERAATSRLLKRTIIVASLLMLACLLVLIALTNQLNAMAVETLKHPLSFLPWANLAMGVPLLVLAAACGALLYWHKHPESLPRRALLVAVLALDLASFSWFYEWHYGPPYKVFESPPLAAVPFRDELATTHQRLLPVRGGTGRVSEVPPDLSKLWNFPSASGYGPFILTRVSRLLTMPPHGSLNYDWRDSANLCLDVMAVRYLFVPQSEIDPPAVADARGVRWTPREFNALLGSGCGGAPNPTDFKVDLPQPMKANIVAVASALACSGNVPDQAEVARLVVTDTSGRTYTQPLLAGRDTSEWAYDCADVRPTMRQGRAPVYRSYPVTREGDVRCEGHDYVARLALPATVEVKRIEMQWTGGEAGTLSLKKISLLDESDGKSAPIVPLTGSLADTTRWRRVAEINFGNSGYGAIKPEDAGEASVYENLRARPRAWLVGKVLSVTEAEALNALHSSRLADGSAFDPARVALSETPLDFNSPELDGKQTARVKHLSDELLEVETTANAPAFLVTSDVFYPGWEATIDGAHAKLFQTDYALRGVQVPAGTHTVRFEFRPLSLHQGASISVASLLVLCAAVFWLKKDEIRDEG